MNRSNTPSEELAGLLDHPELWRAGQLNRPADTISSGFSGLDEHLPGGGWPRSGLAELLLATSGVGELRLLIPLMRALSHEQARWVAWINPPFVPYAPAFQALGIDISKILLIHPKTHQEALWSLERASRSGTCSMALGWLNERQLQLKDTRRLQLAARQGRTLSCLFRPEEAAAANSMAELRLQVAAEEPGFVAVGIRKRRGGWPVAGIRLQVGDATGPAEIREQLSLWRSKWRHRGLEPATAADEREHGRAGHEAQHLSDAQASAATGPRVTH
ncbi:MAG: translesion DNA synthesis-associated protein ImuA [Pseudomonadales bacterium]